MCGKTQFGAICRWQKKEWLNVFWEIRRISSQKISSVKKYYVSLRPIINRPSMTPGHKTRKK